MWCYLVLFVNKIGYSGGGIEIVVFFCDCYIGRDIEGGAVLLGIGWVYFSLAFKCYDLVFGLILEDFFKRIYLRCNIKNKFNNNYLLWNGLVFKLCNSKFLLKIIVLNGENNLFVFNDKFGKSFYRYCMNGMYFFRKVIESGFEVEI